MDFFHSVKFATFLLPLLAGGLFKILNLTATLEVWRKSEEQYNFYLNMLKSIIFNEHLVAVVGTTVRNVGYQGRNTGYQDYCLDCIAHACQK